MFVLEYVPSFRFFNRCSVSSRFFSVCPLLCTRRSAVICNSRNSLSRFATSSALCRKTRKHIGQLEYRTLNEQLFKLACSKVNFLNKLKTKSIRKLGNFNFQWTKTLYQNNLSNIAFFSTFFKVYRYN